MRSVLFMIVSLMSAMVFAQQPVELVLWPDGAPNSNGLTGEEQELQPNRISNVTHPTLTVYRAAKSNGMAIIMCPGGGYSRLAMDHEGHDMASWFCGQGITYAVLKYRMPNGHGEVPLSDAKQAIRLVRQHAGEWQIDPYKVGIMGASAGGHLASTLATCYDNEIRPDFQILLYPVVTMQQNTHGGSRTALLGKNPTAEEIRRFSNELQVTADTPQAFIALSSDDGSVPPSNGVNYYLALQKNNVPASLHIYPTGGHGWGYRDNFTYKKEWTQELEKWLKEGVVFPKESNPVLRIGTGYLGTKYVANTLDGEKEEKLIVQTQTVDCLTFIEYVLAQALGSSFTDNLQKIRYRDGIIDGYPSRLHYTSDWIENGVRQGFLTDVTAAHSSQTMKLAVSYMSTHANQYKQLAGSPENVKRMAGYEKALSGKQVHWLPKAKLPDAGLPWIEAGDLIAITTNQQGLDIAHVGIADYQDGKLHLLHASSSLGKVVISDEPLSRMLSNHKSWTGIRVVRMSHTKNN
ncbi:N-acetylmuramoyl-L-alanine amidase-like domain-containing protein [Bacteroides reticulotermitis]|nr:N-acetylmuramoyl-L-alanine amidase-like domain-containing protein [Bacteroides reticulotermitis]